MGSKTVWRRRATLDEINRMGDKTMVATLGIEFTRLGDDFLEAKMPVDERTCQPAGLLHGGASVALAETLGSVAAYLCFDDPSAQVVGIEISASHLNPIRSGWVIGLVKPLKIGRRTQVWEIQIRDETDKPICISRLTTFAVS